MFALSMKRETRWNGSHMYATIVGEVQEDGVGMPIPPKLNDLLGNFADKMPEEFSKVLPPRCIVDHCIELEHGLQPPARDPFQLSRPELEELKQQLTELIDVGFISCPSKSPYETLVLFEKKKDTSELRMFLEYQALNKQTMKNLYPFPLVVDFFDNLAKAKVFSKMDL